MATQSKVMVTDYNFATGEVIEREATSEEIEAWEFAKANPEPWRANLA
jgi:hypothetical protein